MTVTIVRPPVISALEGRPEVCALVVKAWSTLRTKKGYRVPGYLRGLAVYDNADRGCLKVKADLLFLSKLATSILENKHG